MNAPSVTVLMTMFNAARHLPAALESILAQSLSDFEFVIVDDGSGDGSAAIVESYRDARLRLIRNAENKGQTACLNQGLASARGEWIARQDADDVSLPRRLERQMAAAARDPALTLIGAQAWIIDDAGRFEGTLNLPLGPAGLEWAAFFENPFIHTAVFARRATLARLGGYDETFRICQDYDLWSRLLREDRAMNLPDRLVLYRHTAQSLSQSARDTVGDEARRIRRALLERAFPPGRVAAEEIAEFVGSGARVAARDVPGFLHIRERLRRAYLGTHPELAGDRDFRRTNALQHAQLGRDVLGARTATGLAQFCRAMVLDPALLLRLAADRLAGPFCVPR